MTEQTFDFGDGPVPAARHPNGGGWVAKTAHVDASAYVSGNAQVSGNAWVYGNAQVYGNARVSGNAWVYGDAQVYGNARVYGNAQVYGNARVYGNAQVSGNAWVYGDARVYGGTFYQSPCAAVRSDGYTFVAKIVDGDLRIWAGCRSFSWEEAVAHWNEQHRLGAESQRIIHFLKAQAEAEAERDAARACEVEEI